MKRGYSVAALFPIFITSAIFPSLLHAQSGVPTSSILETVDEARFSPALTLENEGMPPTYRKVALNGRPIADPRPQDKSRSDQEAEETFIDALTLQLHHSTTDVFIPLFAQKLALAVRRNASGFVWLDDDSLPPNRRPDLPFGACWSSGLAANVHVIESGPRNPVYVIVTDEEGTSHRFVKTFDPDGKVNYLPMPSSTNEQDSTMLQLTRKENGDFLLRRKFGTTLLFQGRQPLILTGSNLPLNQDTIVRHLYYKLFKISNGTGEWIEYSHLKDNNSLVPDEISFKSQRIVIEKNLDGYVGAVIDPLGRKYSYTYRKAKIPYGGFLLTRADGPHQEGGSSATIYSYEEVTEAILARKPSEKSSAAYHCNLTRITDPIGSSYAFDYEQDRSRMHFEGNGAILAQGLQRIISHVHLPNDQGPVNFSNYSELLPPLRGSNRRLTYVVDAMGNGRSYRFLGTETISYHTAALNPPNTPPVLQAPRITFYKSMEVFHFEGDEHRLAKDGSGITPEGTTRLIGKESYEFDIGAGMALSSVTDMWGNITRFRYDESRQTATTSEQAISILNTPFSTRYADPTSQINPLGKVRHFSYEPSRRHLFQLIDENGRITRYDIHPDSGVVLSVTVFPDEAQSKFNKAFSRTDFEYSHEEFPGFCTEKTVRKIDRGKESPLWETDLVIQYEADPQGRISQMIEDPHKLKLKTLFRYDPCSNLLARTYPNGTSIQFQYDNRNRLTRVSYDGKESKSFVYDRRGNKLRETDASGSVSLLDYDGLNRVARKRVRSRDQDGEIVETTTDYTYNAVNAKTSEETNRQGKTYYSYDGLQRLVKVETESGASVRYAYGKNSGAAIFSDTIFLPSSVAEGANSPTDIDYDAAYRKKILSARPYKMLPFFTQSTRYEYDNAGNLIRETDHEGRTLTREYDPLNRPIRTTTPEGKTTRKLYTSTGLEYATVDASANVREIAYDSAGYKVGK